MGSLLWSAEGLGGETAEPSYGPAPAPLSEAELPSFRYPLGEKPAETFDGGTAKEANVTGFPVSDKLAGVYMTLEPGALRELHWHANAAEWAYVIEGRCRVTTIDPENQAESRGFRSGRCLVFSARPRSFDPGPRSRHLHLHPGVRQRLFLGVRHLLDHRLARPYAGRGPGQELQPPRFDLRELPEEGSLYCRPAPCRRLCPRSPRQARSTRHRSRIATSCSPRHRTFSPAARCAPFPNASFPSRRR